MDSKDLLKYALKNGIAFISVEAFFSNGGHKNTLRLNYTSINENKIKEGKIKSSLNSSKEIFDNRKAPLPNGAAPAIDG
ncbi:hypothetical protein [Clostridium sp. LS]|uniref:hypothetical protein n=1 Tax=Clostridium sp. LS TaxID=1352601 RepID=UPI000C177EBF|nr:hypothetical protein [Clostridium sp. LS]